MREETKRASESLVVALVVTVLHLAWLSGRFSTEQGAGGITLVFGCVFTTGILWAMLALRSLAADGKLEPELDDGLTAMASVAWVMALVPPRAANFTGGLPADDFTRVYLPTSLLAVFVMLAAQALWKPREERFVWVRLLATAAVSAVVLAGLSWKFAEAESAPRALLVAAVAGGAAVVQALRVRRG